MEAMINSLAILQWGIIISLASTGIIMALLSSLVGMKQKVESPLWWGLYVIWIIVVLLLKANNPFLTILVSSILAGLLHGITQGILIEHYKKNNPWYVERMQGSNVKMAIQFVVMGIAIGAGFGAIVGGIAWGLSLI